MRAKDLHKNVLKSFNPEDLCLKRCRNFARLTRDYMRVYAEMAIQKLLHPELTEVEALEAAYQNGTLPVDCKANMDQMLKLTKNHRCILELDSKRCSEPLLPEDLSHPLT